MSPRLNHFQQEIESTRWRVRLLFLLAVLLCLVSAGIARVQAANTVTVEGGTNAITTNVETLITTILQP